MQDRRLAKLSEMVDHLNLLDNQMTNRMLQIYEEFTCMERTIDGLNNRLLEVTNAHITLHISNSTDIQPIY